MTENDEKMMRRALELARLGMETNCGGPFGSVVVKNGEIIGEGYNRVTSTNDPTAHAEIVAIREACANLATFELDGCYIYSSCEPCPMCLGAIYWSRVERLIFASTRGDAAEAGFDDEFLYDEFALAPSERQLEMTIILRDEGKVLFEEWKIKPDKVAY